MKTKLLPLVALTLGTAMLLALKGPAQAGARLLPFQGRLTDASGNPVSDGARVVQFKIYDAPVGGRAVWNGEVQKLTVNGGLINTLLGTKANLASVDFDVDLYLELTIDANADDQITAADPPLLPRQSILPAVFARESADSRLLNGYNWSALFGNSNPADGTLLDSKIRDGSISASKLLPASIHAGLLANNAVTLAALAAEVAESLSPAGSVTAFAGSPTTLPAGWLLCDGRAVRSSAFPRLFAAIGRMWGDGSNDSDPTTDFNLPDLRGRFLRGVDGGAGVDPDAASRVANRPNGNIGNRVGSLQADAVGSHGHGVNISGTTAAAGNHTHDVRRQDGLVIRWGDGGGNSNNRIDAADTDGSDPLGLITGVAGAHSHPFSVAGSTAAVGGLETRPKNANVVYIVRQ